MHDSTPKGNIVVVMPKLNSEARLCVDMSYVKEAIAFERHPIPTIDLVIKDMQEACSRVFSKLDLNRGYLQVKLSEGSLDSKSFSKINYR